MTDHKYAVGDRVTLLSPRDGRPYKVMTVKSVKQFKVRTKMTLDDDSEWDESAPWCRDSWYQGPTIRPYRLEDDAAIKLLGIEQAVLRMAGRLQAPLTEDPAKLRDLYFALKAFTENKS